MEITKEKIGLAMLGSLEDYVFSVMNSLEFELGRRLTDCEYENAATIVVRHIEGFQ